MGGDERFRYELFNLSRDPGAVKDVSQKQEQIVRRLIKELRAIPTEPLGATGDAGRIENEDTLRTLGYT